MHVSLFLIALLFVLQASAQETVTGKWDLMLQSMPINPIHAALLPNGKILILSGSGNLPTQTVFNNGIYDPITESVEIIPTQWDAFCNGMAFGPDDRPLVVGGTIQYDPFFGSQHTLTYDTVSNKIYDLHDMKRGRWYPTITKLADGRVMAFSGGNDIDGGINKGVEVYTMGAGWSDPPVVANWDPPLYPRQWVLPNGRVFSAGPHQTAQIMDPTFLTWTASATMKLPDFRDGCTGVLLPLLLKRPPSSDTDYKPKVMIFGGGSPVSAVTTEIIDLSVPNPAWIRGPDMLHPRVQGNAVLLPNAKVMIVGGSTNNEDTNTAALINDIYDPITNTMSQGAAATWHRLYHSVALLLPDARVWIAGSNPSRGFFVNQNEIYKPSYLFTPGTRPNIVTAPSSVGYNVQFVVTIGDLPSGTTITSIALIANGAVTHAFDMNQRFIELPFTTSTPTALLVVSPAHGGVAPPGPYMLFLLSNQGIPSVAKFVRLNLTPSVTPPDATITSPTSDITVPLGTPVTFSGSSNSPTALLSWVFPFGSPLRSSSATQVVTWNRVGTFTVSLSAKINTQTGSADPTPALRTVTVFATTQTFTTSINPPSIPIGFDQSGLLFYTIGTATATGLTGTINTFSVSGLPTGVTPTFDPTSVAVGSGTVMTLNVPLQTTLGNHQFSVSCKSSTTGTSVTVPGMLVVYGFTVSPTTRTLSRRSNNPAQYTITFRGTGGMRMALAATITANSNLVLTFTPQTVTIPTGATSTTSMMSITANRRTTIKTYTVQITGTITNGGDSTQTTSVTINVTT